jgi:hypothetical protein
MNTTRRSFLTSIAAAVPAMAVAPKLAHAWTAATPADVGILPPTGTWAVLAHVTDGTDPSTTVIAPANFTADIRAMAGKEITLTGYVQPVSGGFGKKQDYLLSSNTFHCPYCYQAGRGSLVLASLEGHTATASTKKVTVKGTLVLQEKDSSDFYFQLKNAKIV